MKSAQKIFWATVGLVAIGATVAYFMRRLDTPQTASGYESTPIQAEETFATTLGPIVAAAQPEPEAAPGVALVPEASGQQSAAPSMAPAWKQFASAEVVESREGLPDAEGWVERFRVVKTDMKYPYVRIVEKLRAADPTGEPVIFTACVADRLLARVRDGLSEEQVVTIASQHGFSVRKKMLAPDTYLITFRDTSIDALPQALLHSTMTRIQRCI